MTSSVFNFFFKIHIFSPYPAASYQVRTAVPHVSPAPKPASEGAIGMVNGKAKLLRDDYCDGLGDCLPTCPTGAISFVEREATAYDEKAVQENMRKKEQNEFSFRWCSCGLPGQPNAANPAFAGICSFCPDAG